jgi:hypothetical protein
MTQLPQHIDKAVQIVTALLVFIEAVLKILYPSSDELE